MANKTVPQFYRKAYQDFTGGLNTNSNPLIIKENELAQLDNALINSTGILERSTGYALDALAFPNAANSFIRMVINFKRGTTVDNLVVAAQDDGNTNANYKVDVKQTVGDGTYSYIGYTTGTATFTNASANVSGVGTAWSTQLKAGDKIKPDTTSNWYEVQSITNDTSLVLTTTFAEATQAGKTYRARIILHKDYVPSSIVFNNKLIITNGNEAPYSWDNTTTAIITNASAPRGKFIESYKNRVFIANTSSGPSTIYWSASGDETSWDATGFQPVFLQDNGSICAIKAFGDSLVIFKDNGKIYQVLGDFAQTAVGAPSYIRKIDVPDNLGVISGFSVVIHDDGRCYFLAETGVYAMDQRFMFEKVSWDINPDIATIVLRSGAVSAKSYTYDSQSQWSSGTLTGMRAASNGTISNVFDSTSITSLLGTIFYTLAIDSNNDVHIAYVKNDSKTCAYRLWSYSTNTLGNEEIFLTTTSTSAKFFTIGVISTVPYVIIQNSDSGNVEYYDRTGGVWSSATTLSTAFTGTTVNNLSCVSTGSDIRFALTTVFDANCYYFRRTSGVWSNTSFTSPGAGTFMSNLVLNGSGNPRLSFATGSGTLTLSNYKSDDNGTTWAAVESGWETGQYSRPRLQINSTGQAITAYTNTSGALKTRNHATTTTTQVAAGPYYLFGYVLSSDLGNYYLGSPNGSLSAATSSTEVFIFSGSTTITNSTTNTLSGFAAPSGILNRNDVCGINGSIFMFGAPSANTQTGFARRLAFSATWVSPETNDSTLSAWGQYVVSGEVDNGATVTHQVAVNSIVGLPAPSTITSGQIISSDATKIYVQATITMTLGGFSAPVVDSVVLNYTGTGVGAALPTATVFNNELYLSCAVSGGTQNSKVYFRDRNQSWITKPFPVIFMARYKGILYGGSATNGNVYKLNQGYSLNGSTFTTTAITKEDVLGSLELQKEVYKIYLVYAKQASGNLTFSYRTDNFKSTSATWQDTTIDMTGNGLQEIPYTGLPFSSIQFKIASSAAGANFGIIGFVILYGYVNLR